jgi:hypothetical protein
VRFGPFHHRTKIDAKRVELVQLVHKFVQRSRVGIFRNERTRSTPLEPKLMFVRFELFRHHMKTDAKWAELVQLVHKLVIRSRVGIFFATNAPDPLH